MIGVADAFAPSYARARVRFLEAAAVAGAAIESLQHPLRGRDGETLALDIAWDGPRDAERLLIVSSGCHGVEGYGGSGVQVFALHDAEWREKAHAAGMAVLYLHALNPWGFSHGRRVTEDNVDLNRNFPNSFDPAWLPRNPAYAELHALLLPRRWPPDPANRRALSAFVESRGMPALQAAVSRGQYAFPDGLFFGGTEPTWSHTALHRVLREHGSRARHLGWIDLHSGLGKNGVGERIFAGRADDAEALARARRWWTHSVTSTQDGSSASAPVTGKMGEVVHETCARAQTITQIALEFGTQPLPDVLTALRAEQWLHRHRQAVGEVVAARIQQQLKEAFFIDTDAWKAQVISQARQALFQAVDGLSADGADNIPNSDLLPKR